MKTIDDHELMLAHRELDARRMTMTMYEEIDDEVDRMDVLRAKAQSVIGHHYTDRRLKKIHEGDWSEIWPEVDGYGRYTGAIIGGEPGYLSVENEAMIARENYRGHLDPDDWEVTIPR